MMKGFSTAKLKVIIVLNFVVIALLAGLFIFMPDDDVEAGTTPAVHSRIRAAEISLNPQLSWELSLCGSGIEQAEAVFLYGDYLYVFGNTTSTDLDFDRAGIFLAIVDTYGVTKAFYIFGESGEQLKAATLCEGGFLLAVQTEGSPKIMVVGYNGEVTKTLTDFFYGFEVIVGLKYFSSGYFMLSQSTNSLTGVRSLRCSYFLYTAADGIKFSSSSVATSPYSLDPVDTAVISGKVVAICSGSSSLHTVPAMVEFAQNDSPKIKLFTDSPGAVKGFSVYDGDFLLLTSGEGATLLTINTLYAIKQKTVLTQLKALAISEIGEKDGETLYLVFVDTAVYITTASGERKYTLSPFVPAYSPFGAAYLRGAMVYVGSTKSLNSETTGGANGEAAASGNVTLNIYNSQKVLLSANVGEGGTPLLALDDNNLFCVYHSGGDVIITKLRYPIFDI